MEKQRSCTVEMKISELCSSYDSDSLTRSVISVQDDDEEEEEDSGKCAASKQNFFDRGKKHDARSAGIFAAHPVNGHASVNVNSLSK